MGCIHSDHVSSGHSGVKAVSYTRRSRKQTNQEREKRQKADIYGEHSHKEINREIADSQSKHLSNILPTGLDTDSPHHHPSKSYKVCHLTKFPAWRKYEKCSFCVFKEGRRMSAEEDVIKITSRSQRSSLCKRCTRTSNSTPAYPNNKHTNCKKPINVSSFANLLALTALDLTAPASDALLKNRKNAWIQLAGHPGSFAPAGPNTIWKKRITKENYETKAYEALMDDPNTESVIPCFYREVEYNSEFFIEIEDLLQHFNDPNIMDIKMGKRTFLESEVKNPVLRKDLYEKMVDLDPNAPTAEERENAAITKLRYMQFRELESSTAELGFRIDGIRISGEMPNTNLKKVKTKEQVSQCITQFLGSSQTLPIICRRLRDIRHRFECSQFFTTHEIIGSSLLIMYDKHDKAGVWMIDFAKTIPVEAGMVLNHRSPWQLGNHEDGYMNGIDSLIEVCEDLLKKQPSSVTQNERTET